MNFILFDDVTRAQLLPLTYTRPVSEIRIGILTISEKWKMYFPNSHFSWKTENYLQNKFPLKDYPDTLYINASVLPDQNLLSSIKKLEKGQALFSGEIMIASYDVYSESSIKINYTEDICYLNALSQIFSWNDEELRKDFQLLTEGRKSAALPDGNQIIGDSSQLFIEEGAIISASILNVKTGPIYLSKDSEIMEGCMIRGPFSLGDHSQTKMGTKIYGATSIGPYSKVGGELNNVVMFGYSNKGHDGFLGNAVIGEWCNMGADSNNSNLKNNYAEVKLWNYTTNNFKRTGLQFCGLIMGDHAKCGINTMFNTGTVVGVGSNVFGSGFPRNFIPDFSWGGAQGMEVFTLNKMFEVASKVYERRNMEFDDIEKNILQEVFELTKDYRKNYE